jgi:hypothetical protein
MGRTEQQEQAEIEAAIAREAAPNHEDACNACGGTGRWETTHEDVPTTLVDMGPCPECASKVGQKVYFRTIASGHVACVVVDRPEWASHDEVGGVWLMVTARSRAAYPQGDVLHASTTWVTAR